MFVWSNALPSVPTSCPVSTMNPICGSLGTPNPIPPTLIPL